jgi:hypothetical protein
VERRPLEDLSKYSPWPRRLLGLEGWSAKPKSPEEIEREFGREKWGALLARFEAAPHAMLNEVDAWASGDAAPGLASVGSDLVLMTPAEAHRSYVDYIAAALEPHLPASGLVELGCGYGSVVLGLASKPEFRGIPLFAADYTTTGPNLASRIAGNEGIELCVGHCDLRSDPLTSLEVPAGAVIFTAYAAQYVETLSDGFVTGLSKLLPSVVVHVEPLYEHCDESLLGLFRRRYIEVNGYNRNLLTNLHDHEASGSLHIIRESGPAFGPNPLLAASVIAWAPAG